MPGAFGVLFLLIHIINQAAGADKLLHKGRECLTFVAGVFCFIVDDAAVKINLNFIAGLNIFTGFPAFDDGEGRY